MQKQVTAVNGMIFYVDTSDEACSEFGFKAREEVLDPYGRKGYVSGVASPPMSTNCLDKDTPVLWIELEELKGKVCFFPDASVLKKI